MASRHARRLQEAPRAPRGPGGAGLSVSRHPEDWRAIARGLVDGDTWRLRGRPEALLLAHDLTDAQRAAIADWGLAAGLVEAATLHRVSWWDDGADEAAARAELEEIDGEATRVDGLVATEALRTRSMSRCEPIMVADMLAMAYAEDVLRLDGVWWEHRHDPAALSAPRGAIFAARVTAFSFTAAP